MKRTGNLFERIVDRENLRLAFAKAVRGKRDRYAARQFSCQLEQQLRQMSLQVRGGCFPLGRYRQFVIHDPKRRVITAPCFSERVLHHAIMNVCEPVFERWLIHDTYACRTGRGRDAALARARKFAGRHPFFLKMDVRKYFESIARDILLGRLERLFKDVPLLNLFRDILESFGTRLGTGLPIGSLTSQHFANFYLGWFDRFVKETLRVKGYVRYMDDMLLWGTSATAMHKTLDHCRTFLGDELHLEMKPHTYVNRSRHGVDFLGCRVMTDHVRLNRRSQVRYARKMEKLEWQYFSGVIDELSLQQRATSLVAFTQAAGAKSWHFRRAVLERLPVSGRRPRTG